jgi:hypothetical protein
MMTVCPHCHQSTDDIRLGIRLMPLKAALFDRIKAAGDIGITTTEIISDVYHDRSLVKPNTVKAHVSQINDLFAGTDWHIHSHHRRWFLQKGKARA